MATLRIVAISDTHGCHNDLALPDGDVLIHAGDFSVSGGKVEEIVDFDIWLGQQPHSVKIVVAGNHDGLFAKDRGFARQFLPNASHYLEDSGVERFGLKFWGSPYTPAYGGWSFMAERGRDIARHWLGIPHDTTVLITHGGPRGRLDYIAGQGHVGCQDLAEAIYQRMIPINIFGHIHVGHGQDHMGITKLYNVATTKLVPCVIDGKDTYKHEIAYPATVIDIDIVDGFEKLPDKPWRDQ